MDVTAGAYAAAESAAAVAVVCLAWQIATAEQDLMTELNESANYSSDLPDCIVVT